MKNALRWIAVAIVLFLIWKSFRVQENLTSESGVYDASFFAEQDSQLRQNPNVGILQEDVYKNPQGRTGDFVPMPDRGGLPMYVVT